MVTVRKMSISSVLSSTYVRICASGGRQRADRVWSSMPPISMGFVVLAHVDGIRPPRLKEALYGRH